MKKIILLFAVCLSLALQVAADNILLLTNSTTGETTVFRKGSYVVFELKKDGTIREGYIREIQDSSLSFEDLLFEGQVALSEINVLAGTTKARVVSGQVANAIGNTMMVVGGTVFNCGVDIMLHNDYYYWPLGGAVWITGAAIAGIGHLFDLAVPGGRSVRVRNYRHWEARIMNEKTQVNNNSSQQGTTSPKTATPPAPAPEPEKPVKEEKKKKSGTFDDDVYGD